MAIVMPDEQEQNVAAHRSAQIIFPAKHCPYSVEWHVIEHEIPDPCDSEKKL